MNIEQLRAEFEAWYRRQYIDSEPLIWVENVQAYRDFDHNQIFCAYQAGRAALQSQPAGGYPCKIVEADFEAGTVTLQMDGQFTVSAGQKYLCDYALKSQDKEDAERYRCLSSMATQQADSLGPIFRIDVRRTPQTLFNFDAAVDHARRIEGE